MPVTYNELNSIYSLGDFWDSFFVSGAITVTADGVVINTVGEPVAETNDGLNLDDFTYTVTVNGVVGSLVPGGDGIELQAVGISGASKITIGATGTIFGETGIDANHVTNIDNKGRVEGLFWALLLQGDGNYKVSNTSEIYAGDTGVGIEIEGFGTHTITNSAAGDIIAGYRSLNVIDGYLSIEKVTNAGYIGGDIYLGDGNDTLSNSATGVIIADTIDLGSGNDIFTNTGRTLAFDGFGVSMIDLGAGDDKFTGGNNVDWVIDGFGKDTVALGGQNDFYSATGINDGFTDTIDGGTNLTVNLKTFANGIGDQYFAGDASFDLFVNLDTAARFDDIYAVTVAAGSASGFDVGFDLIKNFESVFTGAGNDVVFGNASANYIDTGDGDDNLYGQAGRDYLVGGAGIDDLFGGTGGDFLFGGDGEDNFNFSAVNESTVGVLGRDTIFDFEDGLDTIDFSRLNLNDPFFAGVDTAFSGDAGFADIRVLTTGSGWLVQLDRDGNRRADMAIEVVDLDHTISWDSSDFIV